MEMTLGDVLDKMRRADKVTVFAGNGSGDRLFVGYVYQMVITKRSLMERKVKQLYPELLDGLHVYLEEVKEERRN